MGRPGRPSKLTPEIAEQIAVAVRAGNYLETAASYAGIEKVTLFRWLKKGRAARRDTPERRFSQAIQKALAEAEMRDLEIIRKAAATQWQASAWRLERKFPDRWGRRERHEISGPSGQPVRVMFGGRYKAPEAHAAGE